MLPSPAAPGERCGGMGREDWSGREVFLFLAATRLEAGGVTAEAPSLASDPEEGEPC